MQVTRQTIKMLINQIKELSDKVGGLYFKASEARKWPEVELFWLPEPE